MKAKWIWNTEAVEKDAYCEFYEQFYADNEQPVALRVACDGIYAAYVNGALVAFSQCADFPAYKLYDEIDITDYCADGGNKLCVQVWHLGEDTQTYIADTAGVWFEAESGGKILVCSNENTQSRVMNEYRNGYCKVITGQLGFGFLYDNTAVKGEYNKSKIVEKTVPKKRDVKPLSLGGRLPVSYSTQNGVLRANMGKEVAGFADLHFFSPVRQKVTFTYGEHIQDGCIRAQIINRDFSFDYIAEKGENVYLNPFRRIAGRYMEAHCKQPIEVQYMGIRPVYYPIAEIPFSAEDAELQTIYDTAVYTLRCCMHEHYEDCPWREQALYTMDSRNQMLCGYYAFEDGNQAYARHNLVLISKSLHPDGLLAICAPSGKDFPIPFFSLVYVMQVYEYIRYTGDRSVLNEVGSTVDAIMQTFASKIDGSGLIPSFPYPYWNFYEWAQESHNDWQIGRTQADGHTESYDLILNCMYVYALGFYGKLMGKPIDVKTIKESIRNMFYHDGVYVLSTLTEKYSQLGNALAVLIGLGDKDLAERILADKNMIPATLSMKTFIYDALLSLGKDYNAYIITDIRKVWGKMLKAGATTFWETEKGESDFDGAGSLCHGWSAIPIYYLHLLKDVATVCFCSGERISNTGLSARAEKLSKRAKYPRLRGADMRKRWKLSRLRCVGLQSLARWYVV